MEKIETKTETKTTNYQGGLNMVDFENPSTGALKLKNSEMIKIHESKQVAQVNEKIVKDFLNILYRQSHNEGYLVLWTKQDKRSYFFTQKKFDEASKKAISLSKDMDVYYGIGLQKEELADGGRGREDTVISIPGLHRWLLRPVVVITSIGFLRTQ
jgi:hypothetical protein